MKKIAILLCASLSLAACFPGAKVEVEKAEDAQLPGSGTFAWVNAPDHYPAEESGRAQDQDLQMILGETLEHVLVEKGYKEVAENKAEFLFHYHTGVVQYIELEQKAGFTDAVSTIQCSREDCRNTYSRNKVDPLTEELPKTESKFEGSLIVDVHRRSTNELIWRGVITREVKLEGVPRRDRIESSVRKLMSKLPNAK